MSWCAMCDRMHQMKKTIIVAQKEKNWEVYLSHLFISIFVENFPSKSTIKAQEWFAWRCSGVFIVNFRDVGIENPVEHLRWSFFCKNS